MFAFGDELVGAGGVAEIEESLPGVHGEVGVRHAAWRHDHPAAAAILTRALTRARHPAARSLLQLRLARTLAAQGEQRPAPRAIAAAEHHLSDARTERPTRCAYAW
ncbi:hypothetical protein ABT275_44280 [Streptomyces sp. NPDC001185]|uniref:hypothetical protein n=1 Tax=Streptomyces sp. NPDC001185 TaxID=3154380 RepID=UPI00332A972B